VDLSIGLLYTLYTIITALISCQDPFGSFLFSEINMVGKAQSIALDCVTLQKVSTAQIDKLPHKCIQPASLANSQSWRQLPSFDVMVSCFVSHLFDLTTCHEISVRVSHTTMCTRLKASLYPGLKLVLYHLSV
jgi:hypothetical protein